MTCHSSTNIRLNDEQARLLHLQQDVGLCFPTLGSNLAPAAGVYIRNKHLIAKAYKQFVRYSCKHPFSSKKDPSAEAFLQNIAGNATKLTLKLSRT